ncbi:uncharacterized protein J4E87_010083 [Alternaria ethzedia]|uniref:uncharacterized protein n=1 Tax=Alternaria ethzedia TaxID=181014 RepID=UPI0020C2C267|nr:uncharacterized protein J4E87_010083 [Alternaria ethzedia]KAI4612820.1 hypothetical protein J4E87_010083 [Alternaria ethzedia]
MAHSQKSYQHIEHASTYDCNCFFSALSKTSIFQAASFEGPGGVDGQLDEIAQSHIQDFVAQKRSQRGDLPHEPPSQLYQPLGEGEIRVLELHPGEPGSPLRGTLHVVSIDFSHPAREEQYTQPFDNPANTSRRTLTYTRHTNHAVSLATGKPVWYTALSYVWGPPIFEDTISFEHGQLNISASLAGALNHLRSTEHSVVLWTDQICINQPDIAEKVQQIPLMGLVYTHATNTLIWLGDDGEEDSALAFDLMETVFVRLQGTDAQVTPADFERLDFPPSLDRAWWAVRQVLRRPWFGRLWTIQEAVLSRHLFVKCGKVEVCWDDFAAWCHDLAETHVLSWLTGNAELDEKYTTKADVKALPPHGADVVNSVQAERVHGLTIVTKEALLTILVSTRYAQATNPKDKIYGVLGIADADIVPDYNPDVPARAVYHEACLTEVPDRIYELLSCVDHEHPLQPSWVPDWSTPRVTDVFGYSTRSWAVYCAGGRPVTGAQPPKAIVSEDKQEITLSGKAFDTIAILGSVSEDPFLDIDNPQRGNRDLASYAELVMGAGRTHTYLLQGSSTYDAFLHTLLAGRDGSGVAPPDADHSEVFGLILDATTGKSLYLPGQTMSQRRQKGHFNLDSLKTRKPAKTLEDLQTAYRAALKMRRFAVTEKGYFALVPRGAQVGDELAVFDRACVPFVIRKQQVEGVAEKFELLGEAYVHGIMKGEVLVKEDIELQDITLA